MRQNRIHQSAPIERARGRLVRAVAELTIRAATVALRKAARVDAALLTKSAGAGGMFMPDHVLALVITFIQPDHRARDCDNLLAACTPMLDGVANALGVNDSQFEPMTIRRQHGKKPGIALIEIGEGPTYERDIFLIDR